MKKTSLLSDEGFTFIEVIVAIAILSFSGFIIWSGISGTFDTVLKVYNKSRITGELRELEYLFRANVNDIQVPYWESTFEPVADFIITKDDNLCIQRENLNYQFSFLTVDNLEIVEDGMEITVKTTVGESHSIFALYSTFPLMGD